MTTLTPTQLRGLKLTKDGPLFPQGGKKWTHLNAEVTYAKSDRFKERPQKIKFVTTQTVSELAELGFIERSNIDIDAEKEAYEITMAGKIWLLKNK